MERILNKVLVFTVLFLSVDKCLVRWRIGIGMQRLFSERSVSIIITSSGSCLESYTAVTVISNVAKNICMKYQSRSRLEMPPKDASNISNDTKCSACSLILFEDGISI